MKKILMISNQYPPYFRGGDASFCKAISEQFVKMGYEVSVIFDLYSYEFISKKKIKPVLKKYVEHGVTIYPIYSGFYNYITQYLGLKKKYSLVSSIVKEIKPDIIHLHNISAFGFNFFQYISTLGIQTVMTLHDFWIICPLRKTDCNKKNCAFCQLKMKRIPQKRDKSYLKNIQVFICPSNYLKREMKQRYPLLNFLVIPNGIKKDIFSSIKQEDIDRLKIKIGENKNIGLFVGNFEYRKGADILLKSLRFLKNVKIIQIGSIDREYQDEISKYKKEKISFLKKVPEKELLASYLIADFFILPSRWENFPITILESMCAGLPIITTNVGGIEELVQANENGIVINNITPKKLAKAINFIKSNESIKKKFSRNSKQMFLNLFSLEKIGKKYITTFKNILNKNEKFS